jgi:hypothetical protein
MSKIEFRTFIDMLTVATPSSGYAIGYDLDGTLKQKDQFGVISPIGATGDLLILGDFNAPSLYTTKKANVNSGTTDIYSIGTASYSGAYYDYTISDGTNSRAGIITAVWLGPTIQYNETSTLDVGTTSNFTFSVVSSGTASILRTSASSNGWVVKTIIRSI